ncbi:MAG TPA: efflux RND transporter periplasmic adaptor subunit [Candidatus Baltobacteraceae bacterium]|nr:efflux RND transporter periplasmic adaptor subunit [Candidatus Baltobacteraceae bacterium]
MKRSLGTAALAVLVSLQACGGGPHLVSAPVVRETISQTITASGTLAAQDTVLVGSQVSGTIQSIYVDYNSRVHRGQVLARLDPSSFVAALDQAKATLGQLAAQSGAASATTSSARYSSAAALQTAASQREQIAAANEAVRKTKSALDLATLTLHRDRALLAQGYVAQNVADNDATLLSAAYAAWVAAKTNAASARLTSNASSYQAGSSAAQAAAAADTQQASAHAVRAAMAAVQQAALNLDHATIVSPVDGTVIARNVSVGQTVAAALQAPTLFTIAKDLGKMELDIAVGEPDVGAARSGQAVTFSVLAYPGRVFSSTVQEVRQNPTVVNNVTTYDTVAYPSNRDGALRPGMTANVQITIATYPNALNVPLASLQWRATASVLKAYHVTPPPQAGEGIPVKSSMWGKTGSDNAFAVSVGNRASCYVLDGHTLRGVRVNVLAIDGTRVGVSVAGGTLAPNDAVVIDEATASNAVATSLP